MWIWLRGSDSRIPPCSQYVRVLLTRRPWSRIAAVVAVYWLAGILEGEGSFLAGPPSAPSCPAIRLPMTDPDIVVRVARLFQRAAVATRPRQSHHKTAHVTTIKGAGAALLMQWLAPLMSPRRNRQIERALRSRDSEARRRPRTQIVSLNEELVTEGTEVSWRAAGPAERIAWLAGLLEGEGSFIAARFGSHSYPRISVTMGDRDVLERAMTLMPGSHLYDANDSRFAERGWNEAWMVRLNGPPAAEIMNAVRPWMGQRRTSTIERVLRAWHPIRLIPAPAICIVAGCGRPHRGRGLCHAHYMSWSRDRVKGRIPQDHSPPLGRCQHMPSRLDAWSRAEGYAAALNPARSSWSSFSLSTRTRLCWRCRLRAVARHRNCRGGVLAIVRANVT